MTIEKLEAFARLTLLFHKCGQWEEDQWNSLQDKITGTILHRKFPATTRGLCDLGRIALDEEARPKI